MELTFRWFGDEDPIPLENIRQIPGVRGIVSALYDVPIGEAWPREKLSRLVESIDSAGMRFAVVESIPVHEDIKLGRPTRDSLLDSYAESVSNMGEVGVPVLCYNFMPVFDWMRTNLATPMPDGSTALSYDDDMLARFDLSRGTRDLPGWATAYDARTLESLLLAYSDVDEERLWENLAYFLERIVPVADSAGVKMAIHPDDPPWSIFGIPRIIRNAASFDRLLNLVDHPANGITFCTGSLAAHPDNDLPRMARHFGELGRIHFAHCRNIKRTGDRKFVETPHPSEYGDVDMRAVLTALRDSGFDGPMRPDHGRMIWGERGRPGYGLHDRALGATYLYGLWEGLSSPTRS
ncbi:MAG TPA: mannonate dehydratase [Gemmatimonadaceae bacterium]|nr:mannonate dehydratase [Gemmatimonadaceae bacterium]